MNDNGIESIGRVIVDIEISNNRDIVLAQGGFLDVSKIRRKAIAAVVDSSAMRLVLPESLVQELGLPLKKSRIQVTYPEVGAVHLSLLGRDGVYSAIVEPKVETPLIGAIVLGDLDFLVDVAKLRLVPRDPDYIVAEIE